MTCIPVHQRAMQPLFNEHFDLWLTEKEVKVRDPDESRSELQLMIQ